MQSNHHVGRLVRPVNFQVRGDKQTKIAYFKLAINDLKDGKATYIDYVAFNKTAELIRDFVTDIGQVVEVEFVMRNHDYTDKTTNKKVYTMQNLVTQFRTFGKKKSEGETSKTVVSDSQNIEQLADSAEIELPPYPNFNDADFDIMGG